MKKKNVIFRLLVISAAWLIFWLWQLDIIQEGIRDFFDVNSWERISKIETSSALSFIQYDSGNDILWLTNGDDSLYKMSLASSEDFQKVTVDTYLVRNVCIGNDVVFVFEGGSTSYLINKFSKLSKFLSPQQADGVLRNFAPSGRVLFKH